ncbi:unnamed protein product [Phytomonas sp. Hart1]|nr:unnamed protein product [Phytomonas sp. Hart1]|eukprot:CCW67469.1 unnamed protein product [Phytomonas sp. isolate Hart1]
MVWGKSLRKHLRAALSEAFKALVQPSALAGMTSMPLMGWVLALYHAARVEGLNFASELLTNDGTEWRGRRGLLRFACDGLVKMLYAEKLLAHCREVPNPPTAPGAPSGSTLSRSPSLDSWVHSLDSASSLTHSPPPAPFGLSRSRPTSEETAWPSRKRPKAASESDGTSVETRTRASSSSFGSCYSSDRSSFPDSPTHGAKESPDGLEGAREGKTAEVLESEAVLQQRSAQYWIAFCEVYGTQLVETLNVYVEDETRGMVLLSPPPPYFWVSHLLKASSQGSTITTVIDTFLNKILELSTHVRLIK